MEIFGTNLGITLSNKTLRAQVEQLGWTVQKIKFDSKLDRYTAEAKDETGLKLSRNGKTETLALSNLILAITMRKDSSRLSRWNTTFTPQLADIAEAYSKAPLYEPKASIAFMELAKDSERRALVLAEHLQIQVVNDPEPYKNPQKLADDVKKKRNLLVSRVGADHPLWSEKQVIAFRVCHDVLGYVAADAGWDWAGENLSFAHHAALLSTEAQKALFSESVAQTAYATHYRAYSQQKVALFPQFLDKAQKVENPHDKHPGVHPSQSFPAVPMPSIKHISGEFLREGDTEAHRGLYTLGAIDGPYADPNYGWESSVQPIMTPNGMTLRAAYDDPLDVGNGLQEVSRLATSPSAPNGWGAPQDNGLAGMMEQNAAVGSPAFTDREWEYLQKQAPGELLRFKTAVSNALRAALFSPRNKLHDNALHYQEISHIKPGESDPWAYHNHLSARRNEYNIGRWEELHPGRGEEMRDSHLPFVRFIKPFTKYVQQLYDLSPADAQEEASRLLAEYRGEEEAKIRIKEADKDPDRRLYPFEVEAAANTQTAKRIETMLKEHKAQLDKAAASDNSIAEPHVPGQGGWEPNRYPAWFYSMAVDVGRMEQHIDTITKAALEDVHNHNGQGYHFRTALLQLQIPNLGPKIASFAWLLLQPLRSELATMDTHMMAIMGKNKAPKAREYFMEERALADRRNAAGYGDVPLGSFQWLMWDAERTAGNHQDHTALRPVDPTHWRDVTWHKSDNTDPNWGPQQPWWAATQGSEQPTTDDWMGDQAKKVSPGDVPWQGLPDGYGRPTPPEPADGVNVYAGLSPSPGLETTSRVAMRWDNDGNLMAIPPMTPEERLAYVVHPQTGEHIIGRLGQSAMSHIMETMHHQDPREVWAADYDVGKELPMPSSIPAIPEASTPAVATF